MEGKKRILGLLLTFAIAVAGGIIGIKLKLPAGGDNDFTANNGGNDDRPGHHP